MDFGIDFALKYIFPLYTFLIILEYYKAKENYNLKESASSFVIAGVSTLISTFTQVVGLGVFIIIFNLFLNVIIIY